MRTLESKINYQLWIVLEKWDDDDGNKINDEESVLLGTTEDLARGQKAFLAAQGKTFGKVKGLQ